MSRKYNVHTPEYKLRVALEAFCNTETVAQIASKYKIHASRVCEWKKHLVENGSDIFKHKSKSRSSSVGEDVSFLQQQIGKLTVELEWLKKKHGVAN
jgi:transposase